MLRSLLPGLGLSAAATAVLVATGGLLPAVSPLVLALILGALAGSAAGTLRPGPSGRAWAATQPGTAFTARTVLRAGVALLGLQLSVPQVLGLGVPGLLVVVVTVGATFAATLALGRRLGVSRDATLLVATGFAICGAAAVSAMAGVAERAGGRRADSSPDPRDDVAAALALVTVYGSLAVLVLPWLATHLGLTAAQAGLWVGASVQEVAQVVAAAGAVSPDALATATVAKLARVALLAPVVAVAGAVLARRAPALRDGRRPAPVPWFVAGFLVAVVVRSTGLLPQGLLDAAQHATTLLLVAAMFAMGLGVDLPRLARTGRRVLVLGALGSVVVTGTALGALLAVGV